MDSEIDFSMQPQQQSNWCWAATATSMALFYDPASSWTQCSVADGVTGYSDCCTTTGAGGHCNVPMALEEALTKVGHLDHYNSEFDSLTTIAQIETEMTAARPLGIRFWSEGGGAHFLCIRGHNNVDGVNYVSVDDPIYGRSDVAYSTLKTTYHGTGLWTHTYYTKRGEVTVDCTPPATPQNLTIR